LTSGVTFQAALYSPFFAILLKKNQKKRKKAKKRLTFYDHWP
jgi:hypothetical protein